MYLYPRLSDTRVGFTSFALFMGAAMSITAFPVLARILTDQNMLQSRLGTVAISCAAVDDLTGWCVLAYIVVLVRAARSTTPMWLTISGLFAFILIMIYGVRRILVRLDVIYRRDRGLSETAIALVVLFLLISAYLTESLGIHVLFGAFLAGAVMPKHEDFVRYMFNKLQVVPVVILLPLFFALTGLRTNIEVMRNAGMWSYCLAIIAVAIGGKLGGSMIASYIAGMPLRDAVGLGILMNTRGLMELVILNIGRDLGVISPALFSMMVFMALITTFMTAPLLHCIQPSRVVVLDSLRVRPQDGKPHVRVAAG
jgi:Kef-type K+ transport system membrane component KefB